MSKPNPPNNQTITTLYALSIELQTNLIQAQENQQNDNTYQRDKHLQSAEAITERIAIEFSNTRLNHTTP